ncbi:unnamed protein product [Lactuca saligna]|uniref:Uncharacterized protein n=1 Tax=Lactuca saligna TaxID=75948 RepID=A0AA35VIR9_LACSI|nr:unnamed protein product [Lactuca saligna]
MGWCGFLRLYDRTYEEPTMEFLSTYARDDVAKVLTFQLKGEYHRLTYAELDSIMGVDDPDYTNFRSHYLQPKSTANQAHRSPIWRIAHQVLTTSIFRRLEPGQINRCKLFFLRSLRCRLSLSFSAFFLDKCDSIRQRTTEEIFFRGLITIIGPAVGLDFPAPKYIPADNPPNFLLDCDALIRMEMLLAWGTRMYKFDDDEGDNAEELEEEDEEDDEMPEAEENFDQPSVQQPMYQHDHFQAPPQHFDQSHQHGGHKVPSYLSPTFFD